MNFVKSIIHTSYIKNYMTQKTYHLKRNKLKQNNDVFGSMKPNIFLN